MASQAVVTTAAVAPSQSQSVPVAWAIAFLHGIGAPITANNIANIIRWGTAESGTPTGQQQAYGGWANYNPLNVVHQPGIADVGQGGTQGDIANFGSLTAGATASAHLFGSNPNAQPIIAALKADASPSALNGAVNSFYGTWGGSINFAGVTPDTTGSPSGVSTTSAIGDIGSALGNVPILGSVLHSATATAGLAEAVLRIFTNWRYVLEVFAGITMMGLGVLIILVDTGAARKGVQAAGTAGTVAALA